MNAGSLLYMSGFYESDIPFIQEKAESLGLTYQGFVTKKQLGSGALREKLKTVKAVL